MTQDWHAIDGDLLRRSSALKWSGLADGEIGAWVAEMDFGTSAVVTAALRHAVEVSAFGYAPPDLQDNLRSVTASWYRSLTGAAVEAADVYAVPDVLTALEMVIHHAVPAESAIAVPVPAYMPFLTLDRWAGRRVIRVPFTVDECGGPRYDIAAIDAAFADGAGLLVLCNPHNPLGRLLRRAEGEELARVVESHGGVVFSDEIHAPLVLSEDVPFVPYATVSPAAAAHTFTAISASKGWNIPGLKCAQVIVHGDGPRAVMSRVRTTTSTLGLVATVAAYTDRTDWRDLVICRLRSNVAAYRELVETTFAGTGSLVPEATYLGWLDLRGWNVEPATAAWLRETTGIVATDGAACGAEGFVRLNLATSGNTMSDLVQRITAVSRTRTSNVTPLAS